MAHPLDTRPVVPAPCSGLGYAATLLALLSLSFSASAQTFDEDAAVALAKKSGCLKCHSIDKRKKAPSYREIAAKFRARADSETALIKHLTEAPVVKTEDGDDETHERIKSDDRDDVLNVVRWLLSR